MSEYLCMTCFLDEKECTHEVDNRKAMGEDVFMSTTPENDQKYTDFGALCAGALDSYVNDGTSAEKVLEGMLLFGKFLGLNFKDEKSND